jgi:dTDP-4-dehydrorhamnose reductase
MKILVLGGAGMLGHKLYALLSRDFEAYVTFRATPEPLFALGLFEPQRSIASVAAEDFETVSRAVGAVQPEVVINCIGVVKQAPAASNAIPAIEINALFPHRLAALCQGHGIRVIHISTDCVFSGRKGYYDEQDSPDAEDIYGRTKLLGEIAGNNSVTMRTSMIGREIHTSHGLLEWFLAQEGHKVRGFRHAIFSGFTTIALARILRSVMVDHRSLSGLWHVASEPISKLDLLLLIRQIYGLRIEIEADETFVCDRSLNATRFREATKIAAPSWHEMVDEMHRDAMPYAEIRRSSSK